MEITGKVVAITEQVLVWQKQNPKQSIVVKETTHEEDHKNNWLCIDFFGEWVKKIASLTKWDIVKVSFNTSTREWEWKIFNNVSWRKVELVWAGNTATTDDDWLPFN